MGTVTEGSVRRHLAIAELVVATLGNVEGHRTVPRDNPLALAIAEGADLGMTAAAPVVDLAAVQINVRREDTGERGHGWRSIATLLVGSALAESHNLLLREVRHIIHGDAFARSRRAQHLGLGCKHISLVRLHLAASGTMLNKMSQS